MQDNVAPEPGHVKNDIKAKQNDVMSYTKCLAWTSEARFGVYRWIVVFEERGYKKRFLYTAVYIESGMIDGFVEINESCWQ